MPASCAFVPPFVNSARCCVSLILFGIDSITYSYSVSEKKARSKRILGASVTMATGVSRLPAGCVFCCWPGHPDKAPTCEMRVGLTHQAASVCLLDTSVRL